MYFGLSLGIWNILTLLGTGSFFSLFRNREYLLLSQTNGIIIDSLNIHIIIFTPLRYRNYFRLYHGTGIILESLKALGIFFTILGYQE